MKTSFFSPPNSKNFLLLGDQERPAIGRSNDVDQEAQIKAPKNKIGKKNPQRIQQIDSSTNIDSI
jgi:hypothetical protein